MSSPLLFGKTHCLEAQIDESLDKVSEGGIYFQRGIELIELKERANELSILVIKRVLE